MNPVELFKKNRKEKHLNKLTDFYTDLYLDAMGDPYARNRMINNTWRKYAEENKVTGLKSLIHELELRWKSTPGLGGLPEGPSLWLINCFLNSTVPINKLLEKIK